MSIFRGAAAAVVNSYDKYPRLNAPYSYLLAVESMKSVVSKNPASLGRIYVITEFRVIDTNDPAPSHQVGCHVSETISNEHAQYFLPEVKNLLSKILGLKESDPAYKQYLNNDSPDPSGNGMTVTEAFFTACCSDAQPLAKRFVAARVTEQTKKNGGTFPKAGWHIVSNPNTWRETELGGIVETAPSFALPAPAMAPPVAPVAPAMAPPALVTAPPAAPPALPPAAPPAAPWVPRDGWIYHPGNQPGDTTWCFNPATQQPKLTSELRVAQGG